MLIIHVREVEVDTVDTTDVAWNPKECRPKTLKEKFIYMLVVHGYVCSSCNENTYSKVKDRVTCTITFDKPKSFEYECREASIKEGWFRKRITLTQANLDNFVNII